jgi:hypothetical protein
MRREKKRKSKGRSSYGVFYVGMKSERGEEIYCKDIALGNKN